MSKFENIKWAIFGERGFPITGKSTVMNMIAEQALHERHEKKKEDGHFEMDLKGHFIAIASSTKECPAMAFGDTLESAQKNAFLIAAAPDLLAALIGLDEAFCSINEFSTKEERHDARLKLIAARAAIAKATGQVPA